MNKIIECVPNFSEGRDLEKLEKILDCFRGKEDVKLLDYSSDKDHNRSVVTVIGEPEALRDAMVAGLTLNVFNKHSDRVKMANIAQTINVLQAVALTDEEEMLLTPTYHVFRMFRDHQENTLLGSFLTTPMRGQTPQLIESVSMKEDGTIVATIVNTSAAEPIEMQTQIADFRVSGMTAEILTGDPHDHNDFEHKDKVHPVPFTGFTAAADGFTAVIPPCSAVKFLIR